MLHCVVLCCVACWALLCLLGWLVPPPQVLGKLPGKCDQVVSVIDTGYHGKHFFMIMEVRE